MKARIIFAGLTLMVMGCGGSAYTLEPAYVGPDAAGYRVIVYVPDEAPEIIRSAAAEQATFYKVCPSGFDVKHVSRRQISRTLAGDLGLNVVIACR
jgi:hypothetical protein